MSKTSAREVFDKKAPGIMTLLMQDFGLDLPSSAAVLGNLGHECGGFTLLQEVSPTVKGSRGGFGWSQWTGPRRRDYEAYCKRNNLDPLSDKANYAFLWVELKGTEKGAIPAVLAADTLEAKVEAFEQAFLRAGIKHYPSRIVWAKRALSAWESAGMSALAPVPTPEPLPHPEAQPMNKYNKAFGALIGALIPIVATLLPAFADAVPAPYGQLLVAIGAVVGTWAASPNASKA